MGIAEQFKALKDRNSMNRDYVPTPCPNCRGKVFFVATGRTIQGDKVLLTTCEDCGCDYATRTIHKSMNLGE